jgi:hypothetical protein
MPLIAIVFQVLVSRLGLWVRDEASWSVNLA